METLKNIIKDYKGLVKKFTGNDFPQDPVQQLILAIEAVFNSWNTPRAQIYRKLSKFERFRHSGKSCNPWFLVTWVIPVEQL